MNLDEIEEQLRVQLQYPSISTDDRRRAMATLVEVYKVRELSSIREVLISLRKEFSKTFEVK